MSVAIITGAGGLVGSECVRFYCGLGLDVVGIDNDMRSYFFGKEASTGWNLNRLKRECGRRFQALDLDIRHSDKINKIFRQYGSSLSLVIHTAAQPSHDWASREPFTDFSVNAHGTLTLLEACRLHSPNAVFIFTSTNKVYGDTPNRLPLRELKNRWELPTAHPFYCGIDESMTVDQSTHSLFGASKLSADIMVQEYGRYFGLKTGCFRGGCLTGPSHSGAELHGFLAYLMKCAVTHTLYKIYGYKGKQVRDNIHSEDLTRAFHEFYLQPRSGEVYNIGGGRHSNCSILEAIRLAEKISGNPMRMEYVQQNRTGDHIWWISSLSKFQSHFPQWKPKHTIADILKDIYEATRSRRKQPDMANEASLTQ